MEAPSPGSTPKRKRSDGPDDRPQARPPSLDTAQFTFQLPQPAADDEGSSSPRTRVAHRFRGLVLGESGGGVAAEGPASIPIPSWPRAASTVSMDLDDNGNDDTASMRKRKKLSTGPGLRPAFAEIPETPPAGRFGSDAIDGHGSTTESGATTHASPHHPDSDLAATVSNAPPGKGRKPGVTAARTKEPKPRSRKRAGTPPLMMSPAARDPNAEPSDGADDEDDAIIVDPVRAALTWHEDEITVYDSEDSDDDGTGINGIGFKPTPAVAYARTVKRKQQLAEYRKREEREARARRSQRRRGSPAPAVVGGAAEAAARRVRFMDAESAATALTT